jgi:hypothetical protein
MKRNDENCSCQDPYADLPVDLRPKPVTKNSGLRKTECSECGQEFWTNHSREICISCERQDHVKG